MHRNIVVRIDDPINIQIPLISEDLRLNIKIFEVFI